MLPIWTLDVENLFIMSYATIDNLPDEVLEYIFYLLPPYKDIRCCMLVCKKWREIAKSECKITTFIYFSTAYFFKRVLQNY